MALLSILLAFSTATQQQVDCGIGGKQDVEVAAVTPTSAHVGTAFNFQVGGDSNKPASVSGSDIKNMVWYYEVPAGVSASNPVVKNVGNQGKVVKGSGTVGDVAVALKGNVIQLSATGPVKNGDSFVPPGFAVDLKPSAVGTLTFTLAASPTYSLAAGSFNIKCNAVAPLNALAKVQVSGLVNVSSA